MQSESVNLIHIRLEGEIIRKYPIYFAVSAWEETKEELTFIETQLWESHFAGHFIFTISLILRTATIY